MSASKEQYLSTLRNMLRDEERYYKLAQNKRRKLTPSERAMTLAHYAMNIEALKWALERLLDDKA